ncbi:MAG TPA: SpoIIE family protein phosphatase [Verrucomicrobiae bacterium]|nr:SpoIIE family protein phosphatase [Verrucomicrobiae bacterium]
MRRMLSPKQLQDFGCYEILNSLAEGAYVTDADRKILFWNRAAEAITGWPASAVVGHACKDNILVHTDKDGHELCGRDHCPLYRSIVTDHPSDKAVLVYAQSKSGHRIPVEVTVAPIRDTRGKVVGGIELFRDMTPAVADMLRAKKIQQSCLDCALAPDPRIKFAVRYTPTEIVGGDFYRIERLTDDDYAIFLADVMGHGIPAALYTVELRALWEDLRIQLGSPAALLSQMSRRLHVLTQAAGYYATAVCANLDLQRGWLSYVRAGHPHPLVIHADGEINLLEDAQPPLGLTDDVSYINSSIQLNHGDTLLFYTDGATEIRDALDAELGTDGLAKLVRENVVASKDRLLNLPCLEEQLLRFSSDIRLPDDLTLLAAYYS